MLKSTVEGFKKVFFLQKENDDPLKEKRKRSPEAEFKEFKPRLEGTVHLFG